MNSIHPACDLCKGSCCRWFGISRFLPMMPDVWHWIALHAQRVTDRDMMFDVPCSALSASGHCLCYETRPQMCQAAPVGGQSCRASIKRWCSPETQKQLFAMFEKETP